MRTSRKSIKLYSVLGVGCALLLPALGVALEIPNYFTSGSAIRAADMNENFEAIGEELASLRTEVTSLQARLRPGTPTRLAILTADNPGALYQAKSTGIVIVSPSGTGFANTTTRIRSGSSVGADNWSLECGGQDCTGDVRVLGGSTAMLLVAANDYFAVIHSDATTGQAPIAWRPLYGDDPANGAPTLVRQGTPP